MRSQRYAKRAAILYRWLIDPMVQPLRPKIVSLCLKHGMKHVLDIGCATGSQCRQLGHAGIRTVGLDLSEAMIANASKRPNENVEYVIGSAFELPFESGTFDATLLSLALHEHPEDERTQMLIEACRVIKPGGALLIAEYSKPAKMLLHIPWAVIRFVEHVAGEEHRNGFHQFIAADGLRGLLQRHGLQQTDIAHSHFGTLTIAIAQRR
ncbi:class I SAM-dependent methyltransferase [Candidatus Bipolaricaulota bacterium]